MQSKRSFFDKTVFKKDLTRFAPVLILYTVCLILGMTMMYMDQGSYVRTFWFAHYMCACLQVMGIVNLIFAPMVVMLLFGDLFNSRMCNALHAMPLRRETFFGSHVAAGLVFSLVPTAVMALLSIPLLCGTCITNAWQIAIWWYIGTNLEYICYFGIAVFCVFCTGSRLSMALIYAGLNFGAAIVDYLISALFTPMLYGVMSTAQLTNLLTPIQTLMNGSFLEVESFNDLERLFRGRESEMTASFWVNDEYGKLAAWALVGLVFLVLALILYHKRDLECAGDAVAFKVLEPVYQVCFAVCAAALAVMCLGMFPGILRYQDNAPVLYAFLLCGLTVGWFAAKMFLDRSTRVLRLKNWKGLGILCAVLAVALTLTYFDVFSIDDWVPKAEKVRSVTLHTYGGDIELTDTEDIEAIIHLQELALEDRVQDGGGYPLSYLESLPDGRRNTTMPEEGFNYGEDGYDTEEPHAYAAYVTLRYTMNSGREVLRFYYVWADQEEGDIVREYMSDWDVVWENARRGRYDAFDIDQLYDISVEGKRLPEEMTTPEAAQELLDAMKADSESRTMTQSPYYHDGRFRSWNEEYQKYSYDSSLYVCIRTRVGPDDYDYTSADFEIFPDAENTINWLKEHDMLPYEIVSGNFGG